MFLILFFLLFNISFLNLNSKDKDLPINFNSYYYYFKKNTGFGSFVPVTKFKNGTLLAYRVGTNNGAYVYLTRINNGSAKNILELEATNLSFGVNGYSWWEFSYDGKLFACASSDNNSISVYETDKGKEIIKFPEYQNNYMSYPHFSKNGKYLYSLLGKDLGDVNNGMIFNFNQKDALRYFKYQNSFDGDRKKYWPVFPKFIEAQDGSTKLLTVFQNYIYLYDCETGKQIFSITVNGEIYGLSYDQKNQSILVALSKPEANSYCQLCCNNKTQLEDWWNGNNFMILSCPISSEKKQNILYTSVYRCRNLMFSDDGTRLAIQFYVEKDNNSIGRIYLYKVNSNEVYDEKILIHGGPYYSYERLILEFNESTDKLLSGVYCLADQCPPGAPIAVLWDTETGLSIKEINESDVYGSVFDIVYSQFGQEDRICFFNLAFFSAWTF